MFNNKSSKYFAFTLAEVLIVLGIIGVVAAMTIPTLMQNNQDQELKAAWKKEYSVLSEAATSILHANGETVVGAWSTPQELANAFLPYLKYAKYCDNGSTGGCFYANTSDFKYYVATNTYITAPAIILSDGSMVSFWYHPSWACGSSDTAMCAILTVDVNGFKPPNISGRDLFIINVYKNKMLPLGALNLWGQTPDNCPAKPQGTSANDYACGAKYLLGG